MLEGRGPEQAQVAHYHLDHLGTPQDITDAHGELLWSARLRAYGSVAVQDIAKIDNPLRFQGQYFDAETGLHYNRNRYYNPRNGRYLTPDPIGLAGGLNGYQYVPDPTGWVDPLGLASVPGGCPGGKGGASAGPNPTAGARVDSREPNAPDIPWSSASVKRASDQLDQGSKSVTVNNRFEAEELFRHKYAGQGYRNAEEFNSVTAKDYFETSTGKENYYHWDDVPASDIPSKRIFMSNHNPNDPHSRDPHLQLHPTDSNAKRIFWPYSIENRK